MSSKAIFTHFIIATLFAHAHASTFTSGSSSHSSRSDARIHRRNHVQPPQDDLHRRGVEAKLQQRQETSSGTAEYALVGCFSELSAEGTHLLNHLVAWDQVSLQSCIESCHAAGSYTFAGVLAGKDCICDNAISSLATQVDQSNCQFTCAQGVEGVNGWCGGQTAYQVYYLPSKANGAAPTSIIPEVAGTVDVAQFADGSQAQYGLVGCFVDNVNNRLLNGPTYIDNGMTPLACSSYCYSQGYLYAGVEYGNECYCGSNISGAVTASDCTQACSGDSTTICGAPDRLTVYQLISNTGTNPFSTGPVSNPVPETTQVGQTGSGSGSTSPVPSGLPSPSPSWASVGCFEDYAANRVMTPISLIDSVVAGLLQPNLMSVESCTNACGAAGFTLAGLEFGSECYCSNSLPPVQTSIYDCDLPCPLGDPARTCGGGWRLSVYGLPV